MSEISQDKSIRLLKYLEEITRLRSKTVRDIDSYHKVLWLKDIPRDSKYCFTRAWGPVDEIDSDIWIQIKKYDEPVLEDVPDICEDWVNNGVLYDDSTVPDLHDSIQVEIEEENPEWTLEEPEENRMRTINRTLLLRDHSGIANTWNEYISSKWTPWSKLHKKWRLVQSVYSCLFSIHQDQLKLGEEYELVIGIGFLQWTTDRGYHSKRHIIVANANLDFDAKNGKFNVNPATDGARLSIEFDMLEPEDQPPYKARKPIEKSLLESSDDPWDKSIMETVQKSIANSLGKGQGEYHENNLGVGEHGEKTKPLINFAPALILRKRNAKSLQQVLQAMREQIINGGDIPKEFFDLSEGKSEKKIVDKVTRYESEEGIVDIPTKLSIPDQTIYFPLPSNQKQNEIITKANFNSGVLVQGPPGTGKSHTIANLICHLLATGKTVLVTAKTPRALRVLKDKLPKSVQPLCISLLGSGIEEQKSLESSVVNILTNQDQWNGADVKKRIEAGHSNLYQLKKEKADLDFRIRAVRESETVKYSVVDNIYTGTAAKIALKFQKEKELYGWFEDVIPEDLKCPFRVADLIELRRNLKELTCEKREKLRLNIPKINEHIPDVEKFSVLVQEEKRLLEKTSSRAEIFETDMGQILMRSNDLEDIQNVIREILKLTAAVESISKRPLPWIKTAVFDILSEKDTPWKDLLSILNKNLNGLKEQSYLFENVKFEFPENIERKKLLADARDLYAHFNDGGKCGFGIFSPKVIKSTRYIKKVVKVDSQECGSQELLGKVIDFLELQQKVSYCWSLWEGKTDRIKGPLFLQIGELEELGEALEGVVQLYNYLVTVKGVVSKIEGLGEVAWHYKEAILELLKVCQVYVSVYDLEKVKTEIERILSSIFVFKSNTLLVHPLTEDLFDAVKERNVEKYTLVLNEINAFSLEIEAFEKTNAMFHSLTETIPVFAEKILGNFEDLDFEKNIYQFEHAWNWVRVKAWLELVLKKEDVESLENRVKQIEREMNDQLAELASLKAWEFCFSRMEDSHRRHLMGWQQAIKKIGKGTGKHAPKHRKDAQGHLNYCRDAVPAWVMPLHRVYETVETRPEIFDVIIVDEASQCGPEGLPLTYIGKQLIIVGDDQQISPEAVGVKQDQVHSLMEEYLFDFEHADSFSPDSSLFAHGKIRFSNRIVLREHFRCVPEIIRFSNDQCYCATPLIPLRQYPPERLEPLKIIHVPEGFREGVASHALNRPEAEVVVEKIIECCNDEGYDDKTMGVIALQGNSQAVLIESLLLDQLGAEEMERRRLICGDPYSFQGDERNVIFLSMVADANVRNVFNKASDLRRFNVAASRAQDQMWLVHTATMKDLSQHCLRRVLLQYFYDPSSQINQSLGEDAEELQKQAFTANRLIEKPPIPFDSWFELDVALMIARRGYRVVPQFPFAGKRIDLVIEGNKSKLAVECDGDYWHGLDQYESDMERQRMLERSGWHFYRIRECAFNANPEKALEKLWQELKKRNIYPIEFNCSEMSDSLKERELRLKDAGEGMKNDLFEAKKNINIEHKIDSVKLEIKCEINNIQEALALKAADIRALIVKTLKHRPNCTCVKDALAGLILKDINVISRGKPRANFAQKVNQSLRYLERQDIVETYKSKNVRVRLLV